MKKGVMIGKKGRHTSPNVWDKAGKLRLFRYESGELCTLDPGVNYFVAMLNQLGCPTSYSCEGHPNGFYVTFEAPHRLARKISKAGFFSVQIENNRENYWSLRCSDIGDEHGGPLTLKSYADRQRWAAKSWEEQLGPLDFKKIEERPLSACFQMV